MRNQEDSNPRPEAEQLQESLLARWMRLGFVGAVDDLDLPSDLSTNKRHMEGFGRERTDMSDGEGG